MAGQWRQRGVNLLELGVVVALVAIFVAVASQRIWELRRAAERVSVQHTVGAIQAALGNEMAARVVSGGFADIAELDRTNPIALLAQPPANYLGVVDAAEGRSVEGYHWYFDQGSGMLIYRLANPEIVSEPENVDELRFQVRFRFVDVDGNNSFDMTTDRPLAINFEPDTPFTWRSEKDNG